METVSDGTHLHRLWGEKKKAILICDRVNQNCAKIPWRVLSWIMTWLWHLCTMVCAFFFFFLLVLCSGCNWAAESGLWCGHASSARDLHENNLLLKIMRCIIEDRTKPNIFEGTSICTMQEKALCYISPIMPAGTSKSLVNKGLLFWEIPDSEKSA